VCYLLLYLEEGLISKQCLVVMSRKGRRPNDGQMNTVGAISMLLLTCTWCSFYPALPCDAHLTALYCPCTAANTSGKAGACTECHILQCTAFHCCSLYCPVLTCTALALQLTPVARLEPVQTMYGLLLPFNAVDCTALYCHVLPLYRS
jgi:hypothetical protein